MFDKIVKVKVISLVKREKDGVLKKSLNVLDPDGTIHLVYANKIDLSVLESIVNKDVSLQVGFFGIQSRNGADIGIYLKDIVK